MESGENVNEVEGSGNTPLHSAAYLGWQEGIELLLSLGAKVGPLNQPSSPPIEVIVRVLVRCICRVTGRHGEDLT